MLTELKQFQEKAVSQLVNSASRMLDLESTKNTLVLKSPTGSGKTFMTAAFIERLIKRREDEICFVWVTIGKGELQVQSRNALLRFFKGSPEVHLIEEEFDGSREFIRRNEVVVVNWEKIRSKVRATGEWANTLMKDGEKINFREVLSNTRKIRKIILVIDESHIGATAERTQELREEFDAHLVLEISATPKLIPDAISIKNGTGDIVQISASDVIEEGLIKREIIINEGLDQVDFDGLDSQTVVLEKAFQKRLELEKDYQSLDLDINPLVLIQIPNAEAGDRKIEAIINFLAEKDITEANSRLAIWLDDYPSSDNLDGLTLNNNTVQFLIFKQAIDTGWDCPRAQILVKFRETASVIFEIQILGRILRMPEAKHYINDRLNNAYVFTNISNIEVARREYDPNIIKHIKMKRRSIYEELMLPSYYKSRADYGDITGEFTQLFIDSACSYFGIKTADSEENLRLLTAKGLDVQIDKLKDVVITDKFVSTTVFDEVLGEIESDKLAELAKSENDAQAEFDSFLASCMGTFTNVARSVPSMKAAMFSFFRKYLGTLGKKDAFWLQKMVLSPQNMMHFELIFNNAVSAFEKQKELSVMKRVEGGEQHSVFEVPETIYVNELLEEIVPFKRNVMEPAYLQIQRSKVEKYFETRIDKDENVSWWFKNGVNKIEFLGIKYIYPENRVKSFYPDYVVKYKNGTIGVFETKAKGDDENLGGLNEKTKAKSEALYKWKEALFSQGYQLRAGVVLVLGESRFIINEKETFDLEKANSGDLSDWQPF